LVVAEEVVAEEVVVVAEEVVELRFRRCRLSQAVRQRRLCLLKF
jgi:ATP phosphoribosyltransferase